MLPTWSAARRGRSLDFACRLARFLKDLAATVAGDDRTIQIKLMDNGVGIPPENLNRIFEYGYTTASDRRPSLLHGIGLFFCRQIAHEHGGQIDAESTLGQGTTFTLRLPKPNPIDA